METRSSKLGERHNELDWIYMKKLIFLRLVTTSPEL